MNSRNPLIFVMGLWMTWAVACAGDRHDEHDQQAELVDDGRVAIAVTPEEHAALRAVMQANLLSMQQVFSACSQEDSAAAETRSPYCP